MINQKISSGDEKEITNSVILPMPGTIGGAQIVFKNDTATPEEEEAFNELDAKLNKNKQ
jgi:hypothetical protein